jgi:hypothetical protein
MTTASDAPERTVWIVEIAGWSALRVLGSGPDRPHEGRGRLHPSFGHSIRPGHPEARHRLTLGRSGGPGIAFEPTDTEDAGRASPLLHRPILLGRAGRAVGATPRGIAVAARRALGLPRRAPTARGPSFLPPGRRPLRPLSRADEPRHLPSPPPGLRDAANGRLIPAPGRPGRWVRPRIRPEVPFSGTVRARFSPRQADSSNVWRSLSTRNGGEVVSGSDY